METRNNFELKKLNMIIFIIALFINLQSYGQKLIVTPDGLRNSDNTEQSYVVIEIEGKSAKQLFDNAKKCIIQTYKNPDLVQKGTIENEYIKFDTYVPYIASINAGLSEIKYDAKYVTELNFKDGKVKYEIINLEIMTNGAPLNFTPQGAFGGWYIYNKKGVLKQESTKQEIETYFNEQIKNLTAYLKGETNNNENW